MLLLCQFFPFHSSHYISFLLNLILKSPLLAVLIVSASFLPTTDPAADCGTPPDAHVNGKPPLYTSATTGSTAIYNCQSGYMRVGDQIITCMANGQWSGSAPDCDRELTLQQHTFGN